MEDFVRRAEKQSKNSIKDCYISIDMLYYELDLLNDMRLRYQNKMSGHTLSYSERKAIINEIYDRIPDIYKDINYYRECINAEKMEMKRIYETYGYYNDYDSDDGGIYEDELEPIKKIVYSRATDNYEEED